MKRNRVIADVFRSGGRRGQTADVLAESRSVSGGTRPCGE